MGDNIYLGDRDGVRTPMQWSPDRNAGFSRADFAQLYLPPLMDPVHGYQAVNVEAEQRDPSSFLHWLRRMLAVRHQYPQFATGSFEVLPADNPSVLAYVRTARDGDRLGAGLACAEFPTEAGVSDFDDVPNLSKAPDLDKAPAAVLCVANLSRFAQPVELSLGRWEGCTPIELLGRVPFPKVSAKTYSVTFAPYGIYWFELVER
jgi:maltose alpha-D-glucosyltransferase/alpha-amylase